LFYWYGIVLYGMVYKTLAGFHCMVTGKRVRSSLNTYFRIWSGPHHFVCAAWCQENICATYGPAHPQGLYIVRYVHTTPQYSHPPSPPKPMWCCSHSHKFCFLREIGTPWYFRHACLHLLVSCRYLVDPCQYFVDVMISGGQKFRNFDVRWPDIAPGVISLRGHTDLRTHRGCMQICTYYPHPYTPISPPPIPQPVPVAHGFRTVITSRVSSHNLLTIKL
jgi:hypothetical protein